MDHRREKFEPDPFNPFNPNSTSGTALAQTYDARNRLKTVQVGPNATDTVTYLYNALGQRVQKIGAGQFAYNSSDVIAPSSGLSPQAITLAWNARYVYDEQGRLLGEYSPEGKLIAETIWLDDLPVATIRPKGSNNQLPLGIAGTGASTANNAGNNTSTNPVNVDIYYLHPDHLGTPRVATRSAAVNGATTGPNAINKAVWRWDSDPFGTSLGNSKPNENPQNVTGTASQITATSFRVNNRFPGQLADAESGKYYNYFRDYDPSIGRYTESDPIGLKGGLSTFGYVGANTLTGFDPQGLARGGLFPRPNSKSNAKSCAISAAANVLQASLTWSFPTPGKDGTPWNAMLHCVGACEIGNKCGLDGSFVAGLYHEIYDTSRPGRGGPPLTRFPFWDDPIDSWNDLGNNTEGRDCSRNGCNKSTASCYQCCWLKLLGGRLAY